MRLLCKVLKVPRSVYYYHQQGKVNSKQLRRKQQGIRQEDTGKI